MFDPREFKNPGTIVSMDINKEPLIPKKAKGALANSLVEASREFALFLPYITLVAHPQTSVDPILQSRAVLGVPTELFYWELPIELVQLGRRGNDLGVSGHVIFGVRKSEWILAEKMVQATIIAGEPNQPAWHFRLQPLSFIDPFAKSSRPVDDLSKLIVNATGFALESSQCAIIYKPHNTAGQYVKDYRIAVDEHLYDPRVAFFVQSLRDGLEPFKKVEEKYGRYSFDASDAWERECQERLALGDGNGPIIT